MTKEQIEKRVAELTKMQEDINNMVEKNANMVIDILERFYYKKDTITRKMYITKQYDRYVVLWYFKPNERDIFYSETANAIKIATETGVFDELLKFILNEAIPSFIKNGKCEASFVIEESKKDYDNHQDEPELKSFDSFEEFMNFLIKANS
jgi:hypothetical protein